jgi:beta-glucosidase
VHLAAGERKTISFVVSESELAFWDTGSKSWKTEKGVYDAMIGSSSNDIKLSAKFTM